MPLTPYESIFQAGVFFASPSGQQVRMAHAYMWTLVSGTPLNGVWQATINFPQYSESGTWHIYAVTIQDAVSNGRSYEEIDLAAAGFRTTLDIIRPSLLPDQVIGPEGGTVEDGIFGNRASVRFPDNALTEDTQVAIDVLLDTIAVGLPQGFTAIGVATNYVNIHLTPEPAFPLPAPGLTVTIPMSVQRPAGSTLQLWKNRSRDRRIGASRVSLWRRGLGYRQRRRIERHVHRSR